MFAGLERLKRRDLNLWVPGSQGEFLRREVTSAPAWCLTSFVGNAYRECLENGTWASRINYSQCEPILDDKVSVPTCPTLGPCVSSRTQTEHRGFQGGQNQPLWQPPTAFCTSCPCPVLSDVVVGREGDIEPHLQESSAGEGHKQGGTRHSRE